MKNPNIIFFLIDGLRADQIYGENKTSVTPNIDSLRKTFQKNKLYHWFCYIIFSAISANSTRYRKLFK